MEEIEKWEHVPFAPLDVVIREQESLKKKLRHEIIKNIPTERLKEICDPEREKGCEYCEDGVFYDDLGLPWNLNFCPMCGRKLGE
jgi:hypothetical protein